MEDTFTFWKNNNYNLRSDIHLASRNMRRSLSESGTASNIGPKIWHLLPDKLKIGSPLEDLKKKKEMETNKLPTLRLIYHYLTFDCQN